MVGEIKLLLEVTNHEETKRIQAVIHTLYQSGIFDMKTANVTLHFKDGNLMKIDGPLYIRQSVREKINDKTLKRDILT